MTSPISALRTTRSPDNMAGAVLQSLSRVAKPGTTPGLLRCWFSGFFTLGLLPMITWPRRMSQLIRYDRDQLWHLTEWLRLRQGNQNMQDLDDAVESIRPPVWLWGIGWAWVTINFLMIFSAVQPFMGNLPEWLVEFWRSAGFMSDTRYRLNYGLIPPWNLNLGECWMLMVFPFFILHWIGVQRHAAAIRRYLSAFNRVSMLHGFSPIDVPGVGLGLRPLWVIGGLVLVFMGGFWGLPLMLAGALQRTYSIPVARLNRTLLADRVRGMLGQMRPEMAQGKPVWIGERCPNTLCGARLAAAAQYCPRCGQRIAGPASPGQ